MADNPYVNKVEYAGQTLMDLSQDTATPSDVLAGATFHDRSGAPQTGSMITHDVYDGLDSTSTDNALSANMGKTLKDAINKLTAISTSAPTKHSSITDGTLDSAYIRKVGNTVFASGRLHSFAARVANGYFFQIPEGYRPQSITRVMGYMMLDGSNLSPIFAAVYPNGIVEFSYSTNRTTTQVGFSGSWSVI